MMRRLKPEKLIVLLSLTMLGCASSNRDAELRQLTRAVRSMQEHLLRTDRRLETLSHELYAVASGAREEREVEGRQAVLEVVRLTPHTQQQSPSPKFSEPEEPPVEIVIRGEGEDTRLETLPAPRRVASAGGAASEAPSLFRKALERFRAGKYEVAQKHMESLVQRFPQHGWVDKAYFWIGESRFELGAYLDAANAYRRLLEAYPKSSKVPDALLKLGLAYERLNNPRRSGKYFRRLLREYPKSALAELAKLRVFPAGGARQGT